MDSKQITQCVLLIKRSTTDRSYGGVLTLLADLHKSHITVEQLESTEVVQVLYRLLKTCWDDGVKKATRRLLSKWKREYGKGRGGEVKCEEHDGGEAECQPREVGERTVKAAADQEQSSDVRDDLQLLSEDCRHAPTAHSSSASSDPPSVRSKCVQLLLGALCSHEPKRERAAELVRDVERHLHELHAADQLKYKASVRSKAANLRNPKNGHLRDGLLSGSLSAQTFARMSAEEMAGAELRQLREELSSRGVRERQLPRGEEGTATRKIRCKRCGGSDCQVTQLSRGALFLPAWVRPGGPVDDAMTFVTCSGCGQQWYHSGWVCL
ncbi:transcription elongation factor A N-terminal and central domain-containing protein isoform X2 [Genypterus blacodes]